MRNAETYLKNKEYVAKFLGVSIGTIDRMVMTGCGPKFVKVRNLVRFRPEDLAAYVEANTRGGSKTLEADEHAEVPA